MSLLRFTIALTFGLLAFGIVLNLPASPRWVVWDWQWPHVIGVVGDGNTLLVSQRRDDRGYQVIARRLDDGKEIRVFEPEPAGRSLMVSAMGMTGQGKRLWVMYKAGLVWSSDSPSTLFAIFDAQTGARLHGPFTFEGEFPWIFSPNGAWMATRTGSLWRVYSTATGASVSIQLPAELSEKGGRMGCSFAEDDSALAVWWNNPLGTATVRFYDPGTGRLIRSEELPFFLNHWNWNPINPAHPSGRIVRGIQGEQLRAGDLWWQVQNLCDRWFKTNWARHDSRDVLLQILTRDTKRICLSIRCHQGRYFVSPDRRWVVTVDAERMALWDANPWPRWPWAEAAGIVVGSVVMFAGRRRRRTGSPQFDGPSGRRENSIGAA